MLINLEIKLLDNMAISKRVFATGLRGFAEYANEEWLFNILSTLLVISNIKPD